ncbi:SDR family NAD(P)-dependent oxidoreductase [Rhodococcus sp. NPDC059234]|uniref:SDR family NAD(P)-dependent oxidoreductase n=1 Tax=Rhodococcus sp. NPDC059234 TaxID=3346781 RepID=UPI00366D2BF8
MPRSIVMTGATQGIGNVAVQHLLQAEPDAHLVLLARNPGGPRLAERLRDKGHTVTSIHTDLSSLDSVRSAADLVIAAVENAELPPPDLIVANAGLQHTNDLTETKEGFEATFAVNVLANHVLIRALQPHLHTPSRTVITVSDTHFGDIRHNMGMVPGPVWPDDPARLARVRAFARPESVAAGRTAYSTSKLAAIYLIHEYARRLPAGADIVGFNPGFVPGTQLARDAGAFSRFAMRRILPLATLTPMATSMAAAGQYLADAALARAQAPTGSYIDRSKTAPSSDESYDPRREHQLWETVERLTASFVT